MRPAQIRVYIARIDPHVSYGSSVERVRSAIVWRRKQLVKEKIKDEMHSQKVDFALSVSILGALKTFS